MMTRVNPNQALHIVISPVLVGPVLSIIIVGVVPDPA